MGRPPCGLDDYLDWQERLESFAASGLSIEVYCLKEGVSKSTFCRWKKQLEQGIPQALVAEKEARDRAESAEGAAFVPISTSRHSYSPAGLRPKHRQHGMPTPCLSSSQQAAWQLSGNAGCLDFCLDFCHATTENRRYLDAG